MTAARARGGGAWRVVNADLQAGLGDVAAGDSTAFVVFWWGSLPLGAEAFAPEELPLRRDRLIAIAAPLIARQLAARLPALGQAPVAASDGRAVLQADAQSLLAFEDFSALDTLGARAECTAQDLSVIVCTRERPHELAACLRALAAQSAPLREVIVVDNSAGGSARAVAAQHPGVRCVHEPRPGLSIARNAGLAACSTELVAFTDDDVEVHPDWGRELVRAFRDAPQADAVTGLVLPASLRTEAQRFFQFGMGGFGASFLPLHFDQRFFADALPHGPQVWRIGAGANMAFRRRVFDRVGGFDERLGAGAAGCSEDSELWYRVLAEGGVCLYEPRAVVFHHHRAEWPALLQQMRAYMRGHVAALFVQHRRYGHASNLRRVFVQLPRYFYGAGWQALRDASPQRARVLLEEVLGWAGGVRLAPGLRRRAAHGAALPPAKPSPPSATAG
jgi:GT2 family glycosyltransferase